jgi:hypothetical protein
MTRTDNLIANFAGGFVSFFTAGFEAKARDITRDIICCHRHRFGGGILAGDTGSGRKQRQCINLGFGNRKQHQHQHQLPAHRAMQDVRCCTRGNPGWRRRSHTCQLRQQCREC